MIHVVHNNEQSGPYPEDELRQKLTSGDFLPTDLAWKEGMPEWQPIANILHLQAETVPASQPRNLRRRSILIFSGLGCLGLLVALAAIGAFGAMLIGIASKTVTDDPTVNVGIVMSGYVEALKQFSDQGQRGEHPSIVSRGFAMSMRSLQASSAFSKCPKDFQQEFAEALSATDEVADAADRIPKSIAESVLTGLANAMNGEADGGMTRMKGNLDRQVDSAKAAHEELGRIAQQYLE